MFVDLHMHTFYSDGIFSPKDVVEKTKNSGISIVSITDHDTIEGAKCVDNTSYCKVIPGIEITTKKISLGFETAEKVSIHILGYGIDLYDYNLNEALDKRQQNKNKIIQDFLSDLVCAGANVTQTLNAKHGKYIQISDMCEFIDEFDNIPESLKQEIICEYSTKLDEINFTAEQAISLIKQAGGIAIWAHPFISYNNTEYRALTESEIEKSIPTLIGYGLDGIESDYLAFNNSQTSFLQKLAKKKGIFISAGSDFHGYHKRDKFVLNSNPDVKKMIDSLYK